MGFEKKEREGERERPLRNGLDGSLSLAASASPAPPPSRHRRDELLASPRRRRGSPSLSVEAGNCPDHIRSKVDGGRCQAMGHG